MGISSLSSLLAPELDLSRSDSGVVEVLESGVNGSNSRIEALSEVPPGNSILRCDLFVNRANCPADSTVAARFGSLVFHNGACLDADIEAVRKVVQSEKVGGYVSGSGHNLSSFVNGGGYLGFWEKPSGIFPLKCLVPEGVWVFRYNLSDHKRTGIVGCRDECVSPYEEGSETSGFIPKSKVGAGELLYCTTLWRSEHALIAPQQILLNYFNSLGEPGKFTANSLRQYCNGDLPPGRFIQTPDGLTDYLPADPNEWWKRFYLMPTSSSFPVIHINIY